VHSRQSEAHLNIKNEYSITLTHGMKMPCKLSTREMGRHSKLAAHDVAHGGGGGRTCHAGELTRKKNKIT
jgi:hypothetical protein